MTSGQPVVDLGYSKYQGITLGSGVNQYLGIRYAARLWVIYDSERLQNGNNEWYSKCHSSTLSDLTGAYCR